MLIDCENCLARGPACGGCVVSSVLGAPPAGVTLDAETRHAIDLLAAGGLVPHLRLVTPADPEPREPVGAVLDEPIPYAIVPLGAPPTPGRSAAPRRWSQARRVA